MGPQKCERSVPPPIQKDTPRCIIMYNLAMEKWPFIDDLPLVVYKNDDFDSYIEVSNPWGYPQFSSICR